MDEVYLYAQFGALNHPTNGYTQDLDYCSFVLFDLPKCKAPESIRKRGRCLVVDTSAV